METGSHKGSALGFTHRWMMVELKSAMNMLKNSLSNNCGTSRKWHNHPPKALLKDGKTLMLRMFALQVVFLICLPHCSTCVSYAAVPGPPLLGFILQKIWLELVLEHFNILSVNTKKNCASLMKVKSSNTEADRFLIWPNVIFEIVIKTTPEML